MDKIETTEHVEMIVIVGDVKEKFKWLFIMECVTRYAVNEIGRNEHICPIILWVVGLENENFEPFSRGVCVYALQHHFIVEFQ